VTELKKPYRARWSVRHDGKPYEAGDTLLLTETEAAAIGAAVEVTEGAASAQAGAQLTPEAKLDAAVKAAADAKGGKKPTVKDVEAALGADVTGAEIDAAWKRLGDA
jgi:hypothetical protein